jgi:hypothetical protein
MFFISFSLDSRPQNSNLPWTPWRYNAPLIKRKKERKSDYKRNNDKVGIKGEKEKDKEEKNVSNKSIGKSIVKVNK